MEASQAYTLLKPSIRSNHENIGAGHAYLMMGPSKIRMRYRWSRVRLASVEMEAETMIRTQPGFVFCHKKFIWLEKKETHGSIMPSFLNREKR